MIKSITCAVNINLRQCLISSSIFVTRTQARSHLYDETKKRKQIPRHHRRVLKPLQSDDRKMKLDAKTPRRRRFFCSRLILCNRIISEFSRLFWVLFNYLSLPDPPSRRLGGEDRTQVFFFRKTEQRELVLSRLLL